MSAALQKPAAEKVGPPVRRRSAIVLAGDRPARALNWASGPGAAARRGATLTAWRNAVLASAGRSARTIRVAWVLQGLFNLATGHCYAGDAKLAKLSGIHVSHVTTALKDLEDMRLIVRDAIRDGERVRRRIWPRLPGGYAETAYPPDTPFRRSTDTPFQRDIDIEGDNQPPLRAIGGED